jgi:NAD(P)-dependent dehydrogenase (short-subunit alcohol dehydrogenase family)
MSSLGTIVIVGGSSGIGLGVAQAALREGAKVVIASSNEQKLAGVAADLEKDFPGRVFYHVCDLQNLEKQEANVVALLDFATSAKVGGGKLSHIVNTAGAARSSVTLANWTPTNALDSANTRYIANLSIAKHAQKYLIPGPESSLIFTSGTLSAKPMPGVAAYIGVGGATEVSTMALAIDLAPIRVNAVSPGAIDTPLLRGFAQSEEQSKALYNHFKQGTLLERIGTVEDMGHAYIYLMKDKFQTGFVLRSDGGRLLK